MLHFQWVALRGSVKLHRITRAHGGDAAGSAFCSQNNTLKGEFKNGTSYQKACWPLL